ncbi:hypothetical protein DSECCO2_81270 [anaerobic digester metagenome]
MCKKIFFLISILLLIIMVTYCSTPKQVKTVETIELTKLLLKSNHKVIELKFTFVRPSLYADIIYEGDLEEEDLKSLIREFKTLINVNFMKAIGNKYWSGSRPSSFILRINIGEETQNDTDYIIFSKYNKSNVRDEKPDNIDGYETWYIANKYGDEILLTDSNVKNIKPWEG